MDVIDIICFICGLMMGISIHSIIANWPKKRNKVKKEDLFSKELIKSLSDEVGRLKSMKN